MTAFFADWVGQTWALVLAGGPWLLGGFLLAGAIHALIPVDRISHHLGRPGWTGIVKASLIGIPLPLCSCSVIPVASSIRKQGATRGAFVSFLVSTPETGVDSIAISYALLGPVLTVVRPLAALVTALAAGFLVDRFGAGMDSTEGGGEQPQSSGEPCPDACGCSGEDRKSARPGKLVAALRYGLVDMFADLSAYLIAGFLLAGLVSALIPEGFLERYAGGGLTAMLVMLVVGLPLYVCATSSTPVAAALIASGLGPGAALVFLLVGPATNVATMLIVLRDVGRRGLIIYLATIMIVALAFGFATEFAVDAWSVVPSGEAAPGCDPPTIVAWASAIALALLALNGLRTRLGQKRGCSTS